uniref:Non-haem dioxygenase N-terminal domain-containing protein n=1 Tax=Brassica oleracea var. oleracea TaxID=109376 RepID=A0A0D3C378_BRAOL
MAGLYDRDSEVKAFDEMKIGVKGLVDAGITHIPRIFHHSPHVTVANPTIPSSTVVIPTIDLGGGMFESPVTRENVVAEVRDAVEKFGFFQVIKHGIPLDVMEKMKEGTRGFHEHDTEVKRSSQAANWRDTLTTVMAADVPKAEDLPKICRRFGSPSVALVGAVSATSRSVAPVGDLSLAGSPRGVGALSRFLSSNRKFVGFVSRWVFSSKISLGGSSQIESPANENPSQLLSFSPSPANENPSQLPSPAVGGYSSRAQTGEERKQRCKWSTAEDLVLISSWLNTSKDPVVGNEQKAGTAVGEEKKILQGFQQMWELKQKDLQEQTQLLNMKDKVNKSKLLDSLLARTEPLTELEVALKNKLISEMLMGTSDTHTEMEARKSIICGLSAGGIIPPLPREDTDDDVEDIPPTEAEVVEISDEEEDDIVELSSDEYRRSMGYLIRVEEEEDDIAPEFRRMVQMMHEEEKRLTEERFKVLKAGIKLEEGQSSTGDGKRKRRG